MQPAWLSSKPQGSLGLCLPSAGIIAQVSELWSIQTQVLMLTKVNMYLTNPATSPASPTACLDAQSSLALCS